MQIFKLLLLFTIITSCNNPGGVRMPTPLYTEVNKEFHPFLKEGSYQVEYYASKKIATEHIHLLQKLSKLIEANPETLEYFRQVEEGVKPVYNSNIGITRHEYNLLSGMSSYKTPEKFRGTLKIVRIENGFSFKGDNRLSLLDSLFLNIKNNNASFKKYDMSRINDSIDLQNEIIPKGDTLEAYEFYSGPGGLLGLTGLDGVYKLLIGRLRPSGKTYLSFFTRRPYNIEQPMPEYIMVILD